MAEASGGRTHLRHRVPHNGFEARAQHRPRMASGPILAESLRGSGPDGKLKWSIILNLPRSSNGRTAAFGAVNRGSNPCRGANPNKQNNLTWRFDRLYRSS